MTNHALDIDIESPERFDRVQLAIRIAVVLALGVLGITAGWAAWALYLLLPVAAAILIASRGSDAYVESSGPPRLLAWLAAFQSYMLLLHDDFPLDRELPSIRITLQPAGRPTSGHALSRLLTTLPAALVLMILWIASAFLWLFSAFAILVAGTQPPAVLRFQTGIVRATTRLLGYHASIVAQYPSIDFTPDQPRPHHLPHG